MNTANKNKPKDYSHALVSVKTCLLHATEHSHGNDDAKWCEKFNGFIIKWAELYVRKKNLSFISASVMNFESINFEQISL